MIATDVRLAPTLETMASVYLLSRDGGNKSERFNTFVARVEHEWGLVAYNPMAGTSAQETVQALLALDAENVALNAARNVAALCSYFDPVTLAISVRSTGLWTDRVGTEIDDRLSTKMKIGFGIISLWSREEHTHDDVVRESIAETVRVMWHAMHGAADTLNRILAREGLAYALAGRAAPWSRYNSAPTTEESVVVMEAIEVLGETRAAGEIAGVLFGDDAATTMGWTPLGVPDRAGYRWAVVRAEHQWKDVGPAAALRENVSA